MHATDSKLLENLSDLSLDALSFPFCGATPYGGRYEQEMVLLSAVFWWCHFVFSLLILSSALVLQSSCPVAQLFAILTAELGAKAHRKKSLTVFYISIQDYACY